jgi:hypothetical protein
MAALDDAAAELGMDPLAFFEKNLAHTGRLEPIYRQELPIAAEMIGHPRLARGPGPRLTFRPSARASPQPGIELASKLLRLFTFMCYELVSRYPDPPLAQGGTS